MDVIQQTLKFALWAATFAGVFLAFGWPFLVSPDPSGEAFRLAATATTTVFLVCLAVLVALNAIRGRA